MTLTRPPNTSFVLSRTAVIAAAAVVCCLAFYVIEHSYTMSAYLQTIDTEATELDELVAAGNMKRRVAFLLLGCAGLAAWYFRPAREPWRATIGGLALLAYFAWCFASFLWADDPAMTLRRFGVLAFFFLAIMGLARQFTAREILAIVIAVCTAHMLWGFLAELRLGTFQPSDPDYRFAGTVHPNTQGIQCAALCLATFALLPSVERRRWVLWLIFGLAAFFLVLTKSRTSCAATALGLLLIWIPRAPTWLKLTIFVAPPFAASLFLMLALLLDLPIGDKVTGVMLLGRQEEAATLTGRVPLWNELARYARQRPIAGYGYGGFWNPERTRIISESQGWQIAHSHSAYYETLLNLGAMGLVLVLVAGAAASLRAVVRYWSSGDAGEGFACALLGFAAAYSVTDAGFALPGFMTLIFAATLARLLLFADPVSADPSPAAEPLPWATSDGWKGELVQ